MILTKTVTYYGKEIPVSELSKNSDKKVDVQCPACGEARSVHYKSVAKAGNYHCHRCALAGNRKNLSIGFKNNKLTVIAHSKKSGFSLVRCECGTEKEVGNYAIKSGRTKSCGCLHKENNIVPVFHGEDHPRWKGGISTERERLASTAKYKQWKRSVYERDNHQCQKCGSREELHTHHIIPFEEGIEGRMDLDNGITFCKGCHIGFHAIYGRKENNRNQLDEYLS